MRKLVKYWRYLVNPGIFFAAYFAIYYYIDLDLKLVYGFIGALIWLGVQILIDFCRNKIKGRGKDE